MKTLPESTTVKVDLSMAAVKVQARGFNGEIV